MPERPTIVLFTRDLRICDHPALAAAARSGRPVVPLFVLDRAVRRRSARNRLSYLGDALPALREGLRRLGGDLVVRFGDTVDETLRLAAETGADRVNLSADVSAFAARRAARLREAAEAQRIRVREFPGVTVVPPGEAVPAGGDHYKVFTPYWRAWEGVRWRTPEPAPKRLEVPSGLDPGAVPQRLADSGTGPLSPHRQRGGEVEARRRMDAWLGAACADYEHAGDDLAADATSRLSADLRFGCLSPLELAAAARERTACAPFVRQLAWRDFHHQVCAAFPDLPRRDYRRRDIAWRADESGLAAWREGRTGVPIVDAGMRQLLDEGFMHNRARLITAAFLTKRLRVHWKRGGDHFHAVLSDGDIADNYGNWQWVAGTGNDTRPNRSFNLLRQSRRFDPDGAYIRRYVPELAAAAGPDAHTPWRADPPVPGYPPPLLDED
ncbi:cryptochrome/photolyase family protein [Streptomonospora wellingtoniae]|uniref:Deoxyribodipyrimidine photo-lyase n=1 Tax=Streptomonospora wellingtoniae TaxID=3075544 RepID=A0ABU2KRD6_9ACTN|nr:deoxyribodipyrimidine photo-lyase [Streptomonospora sp. DSM 45055]MDT0301688.1 deoxyribodipyrimidine photo-lyase [Streptomonospora sp. DSM 45055]